MESSDKISGIIIFCLSLIFYLITLAPTVLWGDSAKLELYVYNFYLTFDLIGNHPLHTVIGKLFSYLPIGDFAYRQNFMSAFFSSVSLALLFFVMRNLGIRRSASMLAVFSLAVSNIFWLSSVVNESYAISGFFISALLLIISLWSKTKNKILLVYLLSFIFGLSLTNNFVTIFLFPGLVCFFILHKNLKLMIKQIIPIALFFMLGFSLFIYLFFSSKTTLSGYANTLTQTQINVWCLPQNFLKEVMKYPAYLFYQFPFFGFFIGLIGIKRLFSIDKKLFYSTLIALISYVLFSSNYLLQRKFFVLSPTYVIFAVYIGFGIDHIFRRSRKNIPIISMALVLTVVPVFTYWISPILLNRFKLTPVTIRTLPYRDNLTFYLWPNKRNEYGARKYAEEALRSLEPNSVVLADFTPQMPMEYLRSIEGVRRDIKFFAVDAQFGDNHKKYVLKFIDDNIENRTIYLADDEPYYEIEYLQKKYNIIKRGVLYKVSKR